MKITRFYKHKTSWYKSSRIIKATSKTKRESIEKYVNRTFEALPKYIQESLKEDKYQNIQNIINNIIVTGEAGVTRPYNALRQVGMRAAKRSTQAMLIFSSFRNNNPSLYAKYNSYIYKLGYSSANYFYKNAEYEGQGYVVTVYLELPQNTNGVSYSTLSFEVDMGTSEILNSDMN